MENSSLDLLKIKKADLVMVAAMLFIAGIAVIFILKQKAGDIVFVNVDGEISTYPLSEDREIEINRNGNKNIIIIDGGKVYMKEADCRNQICVNHKPVYKNGESIVCVPNKVSIIVKSSIKNEIDN